MILPSTIEKAGNEAPLIPDTTYVSAHNWCRYHTNEAENQPPTQIRAEIENAPNRGQRGLLIASQSSHLGLILPLPFFRLLCGHRQGWRDANGSAYVGTSASRIYTDTDMATRGYVTTFTG